MKPNFVILFFLLCIGFACEEDKLSNIVYL